MQKGAGRSGDGNVRRRRRFPLGHDDTVSAGTVRGPHDGAEVPRMAKIVEVEGDVKIKTPDKEEPFAATVGLTLNETDVIVTEPESSALIEIQGMQGNATVELRENTQILIIELTRNDITEKEKTLLDLAVGRILINVEKVQEDKSKFEVKTPTSVVGVRGTKFSVEVEALEE